MKQRLVVGLLVLTLVSAGTVGGTMGQETRQVQATDDSPDADGTAARTGVGAEAQGVGCNYTETFRAAENSVVSINATGPNGTGGVDLWGGTGWVYRIENSTAYVVTNWHVAYNATDLDVQFGERRWHDASVVGSDAWTDLAVLRIEGPPESARALNVVERPPRRGQPVAAIGSPVMHSWEASITHGIVSGVDRTFRREIAPGINVSHPDLIQTDAATNPGNSGGPLLNCGGEVVGVINSGWGSVNTGISFASSARTVREVVPSLVANGSYAHSFVGVDVANVGPNIAEVNDLPVSTGVMVTAVQPGSPADGKLREAPAIDLTLFGPYDGDVILAVDDTRIVDREDFVSYLMYETRPGDTVNFTVLRNGENRTVSVTLGERPPIPAGPTRNATTITTTSVDETTGAASATNETTTTAIE